MHAMPHLGTLQADIETRTRAGEFVGICRSLLAAQMGAGNGSGIVNAHRIAAAHRMSPRVVSILKSAVTVGGISGTWGGEIAEYNDVVSAFLETLAPVGAFDRLLPDMRRVPLRTRVVLVTSGFTANIVGRAQVTPISSLTLEGATTDEVKAVAIARVSEELARLSSGGGALFAKELRIAVAIVTDQQFISELTSGLTPISASGVTSTAVYDDLSAALNAIETTVASKLYVLVTSAIAKSWSTMTTSDGALAFPQMTPSGGVVSGMPVVVTDGLSAGQIVVVDAYGIAAGAGTLEPDMSRQASIQSDTSPTSPPTASTEQHSLWQHGEVGMKLLRYFMVERLSTSSVALIQNAVYSPQ